MPTSVFLQQSLNAWLPAEKGWGDGDAMALKACAALHWNEGRSKVLAALENRVSPDGALMGLPSDPCDLRPAAWGPLLLFAYDETGEERWLLGAKALMERLDKQPRCPCGYYWSSQALPHRMLLDALYAAQPFRTAYDMRFGSKMLAKDVASQFRAARDALFDEEKRLYYTGQDTKHALLGRSGQFSLKTAGRHLMALADAAAAMDIRLYEHYRALADLFREAVFGLMPYTDCNTALFSRDMLSPPDEETDIAGNAMVLYALLRGVQLELLNEEKYLPIARRGLETLADKRPSPEQAGPWLLALAAYEGGDER